MNSKLANDCPDEQVLLDYLAEELRPETALDVGRHLNTCTDCALRADQLCENFADIERAIEAELPLPPLRLAAARARLQERQEAYETSRVVRRPRFAVARRQARFALAFSAAVLVAGAGAALYLLHDEPVLTAKEVLAQAQVSIATFSAQPSMTRYQVELVQLKPESVTSRHELVIWTDPISGGYVSRLEDLDGSLRHAVWRPASNEPAYAFDRASGQALLRIDAPSQRRQPTLLASMGSGVDSDLLASGFARWLERRQWRRLRMSSDFALLAASDAVLGLERAGDVVFVVAHKQEGNLSAEVTLTLDAESYQARSLLIHFRSPQGEATFKLVRNEVRFVAASNLDRSVFEARVPTIGALRPPSSPARQAETAPEESAGPDLLEVEAKLLHAVHEAGACLGEPIGVERSENGALAVRGIVETSEMKAAILAAIQRSDTPDWVVVDIRTRSEAIAAADLRGESVGFSAGASLETASSTGAVGTVRSLPLEADLAAYFREDAPLSSADAIGKNLAQFAGEAVERADDLLRSAWALKRLADHYGPVDGERMSPEAWALVKGMIQEHLDGIAVAERESADWLLPVLEAIAASREGDGGSQGEASRGPAPRESWPDSFLSLFESASSIHKDTLALLTVRVAVADGLAKRTGRTDSGDVDDVDRTLRRLLAASRSFGAEVTKTADAFAVGASQAAAVPLGQGARR